MYARCGATTPTHHRKPNKPTPSPARRPAPFPKSVGKGVLSTGTSYTANSPVDTPNIDQIASRGIRFTNAHSPSAVCSPTRYGILTGRYSWRTRLKSGVVQSYESALIDDSRTTVAELLQENGYATAAFGKWHLGMNWVTTDGAAPHPFGTNVDHSQPFTGGPVDHGFDTYFGDGTINFPPYAYVENNQVQGTLSETFGGGPGGNRFGPKSPDYEQIDSLPAVTNRTVQYINDKAQEEEPFFVYMPLSAPHSPIVPPAFIPNTGTDYDRFILTVDWAVGQVLDALETNGIDDETIIFFASDNGVAKLFSTSDNISPGFVDGTPLRGQKTDIFEAGHRIPFVVRWDGHVQPGSTSDEYVELNDLYATLAQVIKQPLSPTLAPDSNSILPLLEGEAFDSPLREAGVNHSNKGTFAIRQIDDQGNEWKLTFNAGSGGLSTPEGTNIDPNAVITDFSILQLYNLATDVGEQTNLLADGVSAAEQQRVLDLQALLQRYMVDGQSTTALLGDLNSDNLLSAADWVIYKAGFDQDLSALTPLKSYAMGDLNGDLVNDHADFVLFQNAYDEANGAGALAAVAVPEPSSLSVLFLGIGVVCVWKVSRKRPIPLTAIAFVGFAVLLTAPAAHATEYLFSRDAAIPDLGITSYDGYADVRLNMNFPDTGGGNTDIFAGDSGNGAVNRALIRWDLSSLAGTTILGDATLSMRIHQLSQDIGAGSAVVDGNDFFDFHRIVDTNAGWIEDTLDNINNGPSTGLFPSWDHYSQTPLQPWVNATGTGNFPGLGGPSDGYAAAPAFTLNQHTYSTGDDVLITVPKSVIENIIAGGANHPGFVLRARDEFATGRIAFSRDATLHSLTIDAEFATPDLPTLQVNTTTGEVLMLNNTTTTFDMNYYEITSTGDALRPQGWGSFADQDIDGNGPPSGSGDGFEELVTPNPSKLAEAYLLGSSRCSGPWRKSTCDTTKTPRQS